MQQDLVETGLFTEKDRLQDKLVGEMDSFKKYKKTKMQSYNLPDQENATAMDDLQSIAL